jgi:hypothetical protein
MESRAQLLGHPIHQMLIVYERAGRNGQDLSRQRAHIRTPIGDQVETVADSGERGRQPDAVPERKPERAQSMSI